ncbi:MAG: CRTAC1 family protein, partial [Sphingobacteriales bacterium]
NGYPRDVTDHDFIAFRNESYAIATKTQVLQQIPVVKIPNYAFRNNGNLQFEDVTKTWGMDVPSFSNGAAYADLDNDGTMDMIINNIDDEPFLYKNNSRKNDAGNNHYLQIQFKGSQQNKDGIGAWADIYYDHGKHQVYENTPFRGYLSTIQNIAHFGLGKINTVDSVVIKWQDGKQQTLTNIKADQTLKVDIANANKPFIFNAGGINTQSLFTEVTRDLGINYKHNDVDFADFNVQKLIPHKLSEYAPAIAVGDVDGNGFDDMVVGGTVKYPAQLFLQQANGKFIQRNLLASAANLTDKYKDEGLLLFDADGDGDLDLYAASGGYEDAPGSKSY